MRFKVGDTVRVNNDTISSHGWVGKVDKVNDSVEELEEGGLYGVRFSNKVPSHLFYFPEELRLVSEAPSEWDQETPL